MKRNVFTEVKHHEVLNMLAKIAKENKVNLEVMDYLDCKTMNDYSGVCISRSGTFARSHGTGETHIKLSEFIDNLKSNKKETIVIGGDKYYKEDVENALRDLKKVD